jgi:hypothetical protein
VPVDRFEAYRVFVEKVFGPKSACRLAIRKEGAVKINN